MLRGRMRSIDSQSPGSTITSSAGQRNQSNSSRPNDSKRGSRAMPKQTSSLNSRVGLEVGAPGAAVELVFELGERVLVELLLAQLQHGLDGRHDAMAARLGQERRVIALRLVGVGAGQVDELRPPDLEQARPRQVLGRGDDLVRGLGVGQIAGLVDEDDPAGHGRVPFQSKAALRMRADHACEVRQGTNCHSRKRTELATAPSAMSTMKTDSRLQVRFFCCHGRSPPWFRTERLFKAQRVAAVVIIVAMPAEQAVAGFFVARNRPCIVLVDFETHRPAPSALALPSPPPPEEAARRRAGRHGGRRRWNKAGPSGSAADKAPARSRRACRTPRRRSARRSARRGNGGGFAATARRP